MALAPKQDPELPSRLRKTNDELKDLQNSVKTGSRWHDRRREAHA